MKAKSPSESGVEAFFQDAPKPRKELLISLRELILTVIPDSKEGLKWGMPWYSKNSNICYLAIFPKHVNLGFARGAHLDPPNGLLQGTGKGMRHIKIKSAADINKREFTRLLKAAVEYDRINS
jgi:hypothetical protein